jgi:predicted DNA-binding transcriptional regulator AlpA
MEFMDLLKQHAHKEDKESNHVMSIDDVSKITGYKLSTIYSKISRKEMPALSNKRPLLFSKNAILKWINSGRSSESERIANEFIINKK